MELSMTKKRLLLVGWDSADWKLIHPLMATGKMAYHHGVPGFTEVEPQSGAIVPVSAATVCDPRRTGHSRQDGLKHVLPRPRCPGGF